MDEAIVGVDGRRTVVIIVESTERDRAARFDRW